MAVGDPVASGLVASIARPGGDGTGLTSLSSELGAKRLDLLKEAFPEVSRVAILWNSINPPEIRSLNCMKRRALPKRSALSSRPWKWRGRGDLQAALEAATRERVQAIVTVGDLISWNGIVSFASRNELPTMADRGEFVFAGGLMAYALSYADLYKRAAVYVDKILRGALSGRAAGGAAQARPVHHQPADGSDARTGDPPVRPGPGRPGRAADLQMIAPAAGTVRSRAASRKLSGSVPAACWENTSWSSCSWSAERW